MKAKLFQNKISVRPSKIHNYGVFADKNIRKGEIIEVCPTVEVDNNNGKVGNYTFNITTTNQCILVLGYGMVYNHSNSTNAIHYVEDELMVYAAKRFIRKGEEIFISYGKNWFTDRNIAMKEIPARIGLINPVTISLTRMLLATGALYGGYLLMIHYMKPFIDLMTSFKIGAIAFP
jgi:hypothetical protein